MQKLLQVPTWAYIMKVSLAQILLAGIFLSFAHAHEGGAQSVLDSRISIQLENTTIRSALSRIEKLTDARFLYHSQLVSTREKITLNEENTPLSEVLDKILTPLNIGYEVAGNQIVLVKLRRSDVGQTETATFSTEAYASILIGISGRVVDKDGLPLPGVNIVEKGTTNGTTSDADGQYTINVTDENSILVFSFIGYAPQEIRVGTSTTINVVMQDDITNLSEVVVIGYGEREKKDVTGAISSMDAEQISKSTAMTPELAMQGRMAGVFVGTPSGNPFDRPNIQIRGVATWGFAEPLYVIDGVPILEGAASSPNAGFQDIRSPINIMTSINPNDIESISVLKDASAAAIYGVRASNGVILITTKRGKTGAPKVEFNAQRGVQNVAKTFDVLNTADYTALYREVYANNPTASGSMPSVFDPNSPDFLGNSPTYDWQDALLNKDAIIEDYGIRVSGGNESTTYYVSGGYGRTEGSLVQNYLERFSLASNVTSKISRIIETGMNIKLSVNKALDNTGTDLGYVSRTPPWQPIHDPSDPTGYAPSVSWAFEPNPDFDLNLVNPGPAYNPVGDPEFLYGPATYANVFGQQVTSDRRFDLFRTIGNVYLQIEPIAGLKIKGSVSGDYYFNLRKEWSEYSGWRFSQTPGNPYNGHDGTAKGSYGERQSRNLNLVRELTINYNRSFGDHNIDVLFNAMDQESTWRYTDASSGQINYTDPNFRNVGNNPPFNGTFTGRVPQALQGYLGRVSYKYQDRYYFDATVRRDGASTFAPGYRWGTFPSFAAGWRISSEPFFQSMNIAFINDLKFRGGWGELGNKETSQGFAYLSGVNGTPDYALGSGNGNPYGTQYPGVRLPNFPNFDLTWERVRTTNVGFDAVLINNRVTFTAEYYSRYTEGVIQLVELPPSSGIEAATDLNIGNVRNNGVELQIGYNNTFGRLGFNASANFTTVRNRLVKMYQGTPFGGSDARYQEGYPLGYLWGWKVGGIFQNDQEIANWKAEFEDGIGTNNQQPGDMYFLDLYGSPAPGEIINPEPDGVVNNNDRTYLGKTIAGYYYGLSLGFTYGGFDLSIFLQGVGDIQKYNYQRSGGESMSSTGANQWASTRNRWTGEGTSTTMPRAVFDDPNGNNRFSNRFVENAGFLRVKNVQLGYTVPSTLLEKTGVIDNVRLFLSGTNLATFTDWTGPDPENDVFPPLRQIMLGISATF
ncbi:MAG TPA: TonB-dependent receptor [Cyclobacteriaceae bacterium]